MIAGLLTIGAVLLALPALSAGRRQRAPVEELVLFAASSLAAGALIMEVGLSLLALPTVLRSARLTGLADVCEHALGALTITNPIVGWVATISAIWLGMRATRALAQARRATKTLRAEPWLGEHTPRGAFEVVTLPTSQLLAFNVDGNPPQVIVSEGLQAALEPVDIERIIRHEQAHLRLHHRRYLLVAAAVDAAYAWLPPARLSITRLRTLLETAADETAAGDSIEERRALARLINQITCATGGPQRRDDGAARGLERVLRLQGRPGLSARATRAITLMPAALLLLAAIMLIVGWLAESHHAVALGSYCPD